LNGGIIDETVQKQIALLAVKQSAKEDEAALLKFSDLRTREALRAHRVARPRVATTVSTGT
jgi:hypothetical protein